MNKRGMCVTECRKLIENWVDKESDRLFIVMQLLKWRLDTMVHDSRTRRRCENMLGEISLIMIDGPARTKHDAVYVTKKGVAYAPINRPPKDKR